MAPDSQLVLVVEDEPAIAEVIELYLSRGGFRVKTVGDGEAALAAVRAHRPDGIVLDIGIPGIDGIEVCRRLRSAQDWTPVLFVTARDEEVDRVVGLELGADDYITKPFSPRELAARVSAVLRRAQGPPDPPRLLEVGAVKLDPGERRVLAAGVDVELTVTEFDLLAFLMNRPGWVFSREQLLESVWGYGGNAGTRTVDVHVAQIRAKLGETSPVRTVRGVGYSAEAPRTG